MTQSEKINWFDTFNYEDGKLFWKLNLRGPVKAGREVKSLDGKGYVRVMVKQKFYLAHRIIYEMFNGPIGDGLQIDHIDGNRLNNNISNLRVVDNSANQKNKKMLRNNTSGVTGVCFDKSTGKWISRLGNKTIGRYLDFDTACAARVAAIKNDESFSERHGK
ncbi:TPA: HNH endonuclease signature motif containing protein [Klebsiella pneumoniae]|uniref:HNH endonuclease signature motif containing protein n=1 Tax=Klebsiella TaxID=570 RepID=UPI000E2CE3A7|nr:HNH endonuclease signature motif containing protein [Klebsiella pneumoniae]MBD7165681.1 HNH endonuclease [Klebsiella pneumoniae]MBK2412588.1 HNH endonuclease [Klebsiella pneumoniae]MBK3252518.1 HNH endonuclease [Klebsiella pneumoniae]MBK3289721.1 HNH endonuclease [Klebsiella pneumoniae]MBL2048455.1 HNH endonuclease [Klebsiella pneumoniae]